MPIAFFKTLEPVLSQYIAEISRDYRISKDDAFDRAKKFPADNGNQYCTDDPALKHGDPLYRHVYLYTHVGVHANLIDKAFCKSRTLHALVKNKLDGQKLNVCSLGGGPGSELLGLVKYVERVRKGDSRIEVAFKRIDTVPLWAQSWEALVRGLEETFGATYGIDRRDWPVVIHRSFLPLDLARVDDFLQFPTEFKEPELFILNHAVSELIAAKDLFREVFNHLVDRASDGACFLIIDRNQPKVLKTVEELLNHKDLDNLGTITESTNMDGDERASTLGEWFELMWRRHPKLTWKAFFTMARKNVSSI